MKKKFYKLIALSFIVFLPAFGFTTPELGIIVGDPTGLSVEYKNFQGAIGWDLDKFVHIHIDYLFYKTNVSILELYVGAGGVFSNHDSNTKNNDKDDRTLGARLPVGIDYLIKDVNLRIFAEIVPTMFLIQATEFDFQWGLGVRYVF